MATSTTPKASPKTGGDEQAAKNSKAAASVSGRSHNGNANGHAKTAVSTLRSPARKAAKNSGSMPGLPVMVGVVASVVGAGLVAGYMANKKGWFDRFLNWSDEHAAAFFDGETDADNFDQTRSAGKNAIRDTPEDWDDVDDLSDASFPASDPPSFNPGTA